MKILFISGSFPPIKCGVGDYTALLTRELSSRKKMEIIVVTSSYVDIKAAGPFVNIQPLVFSWNMLNLARLIRFVRVCKPDIIHLQYPTKGYGRGKMPLVLPLLFGIMNIPVVQTWHEPLSWLKGLRYLSCAFTRDALITVERDYSKFIPFWLWCLLQRRKKVRYVPVGLSIPATSLSEEEREAVRRQYNISGRLIVYFGFAVAAKGIEDLFKIADPALDNILLLCELDSENSYHVELLGLINSEPWKGRVFVTGYLEPTEISRCIATSDVAVFPFRTGMTDRNTSVLAARAQGTFVVTTSKIQHGYNEHQHTWYAQPGNIDEMRAAINCYAGKRKAIADSGVPDWFSIAEMHVELYQSILAKSGGRR